MTEVTVPNQDASVDDYRVATVIRVNSGYWSKPFWCCPTSTIEPTDDEDDNTGLATTDITTGGIDQWANRIVVFLVPVGYSPPLLSGQSSIPNALYDNAVDWDQVDR